MNSRRRFLKNSASLLGLLAAGCGGKSRSGGNGAELRVGMDLSYPPFEMQDKAGNPDGVGVRLAEALAAHLGRPLKIMPMEFSGLIPALKTGNIDLILSSMTATEERAKSIDFSQPYAFTGLALLVRKDSAIQSIDDLKKSARTVTAKASTTGQTWAITNLPDAKCVVFEDQSACVLEVTQGRADAFIYDQLSIYKYAGENPETTRGLLKPFVEESWALGIAKGNDGLRAQVNGFIDRFRKEDGFSKLGERYLKDEKKFLEDSGIPFILR
ncbi:transporter substrate-binding domain-containing protein [Luteolibacter yonseiensis]|uniref:Transporter substrate-binding domain-containing protein n=1 Tax=Luteolibacter yonseiensis TaxID=1144680 RepID=A0A934R6Q3_9BACT|nr:transporter substrate-binding domain-containing protein [Luteolibacter yonseiensis]MBK1816250.1 transporter substrate-binding domain-containing protein [Luteolibacter yonseiensis]